MKKFATLLPSNWLAETPQALALRRLGRQSAERERISGINRNPFLEKNYMKTGFCSNLSTVLTRPISGFSFMKLHKSGTFGKEDRYGSRYITFGEKAPSLDVKL
ncbi:hypothetical protein [Peribacillus frigoritolerans]|uniref:hypothetical protein n=1 Tax=Peribacillus frigoritolerans TaxID=450367 RepID=UPI003305ADA3